MSPLILTIPKRNQVSQKLRVSLASTSWVGIVNRGRVKAGEYVLVRGRWRILSAYAAVQIAKSLGATVIGRVGTDAKAKIATFNLGCDYVINHRKNSQIFPRK